MRISTTSGPHGLWSQAHSSKSAPSNGEPSYTHRSGHGGNIRLERGAKIDLGSVNGKPLFVMNTLLGGFGWTGTPAVQGRPIGKVSQADIEAVRLARSYTRAESEYAYKIATVVNGLYRLTQRTNRPLSIQGFNNLLKERSIDLGIVTDTLKRLGINANETFSVNGQKMQVSDGQFVLVG